MDTVDVNGMRIGDGHPPRVMGVLNMSVESNYAPSTWGDVEGAVEHAEEMAAEGADIVDVGLQSANPKNEWLPPETELERLETALEVVERADVDAAFSIETRYSEVAEAAVVGGVDLVNDVCGFADPEMPAVCEDYDVPVVKMASPPDLKKPGHLRSVEAVFEALQRGGFTDKTIVDPAFGQWHPEITYEDNYDRFRRLREFRAFGRPILTATNREDFLGAIADRPETEDQLAVSLAAATMEVERGAHVIRTHDVPETSDVVQVAHFLGDERAIDDDPRAVELTNLSPREARRHVAVRESDATGEGGAAPAAGERIGAIADRATTLAFVVDVPDGDAEAALRAVADEHGLALAVGDDAFLAGAAERFRDAVGDLADGPAPLGEFAGTVRRSLARSRDGE